MVHQLWLYGWAFLGDSGDPSRTDCLQELPAVQGWESCPKRVLECILVLCLYKGRLYGFVFNVRISDFLKMWLT